MDASKDKRSTKNELIKSIAKETGHPVRIVRPVINAFLAKLEEDLKAGKSISLDGFGTFKTVERIKPYFKDSQEEIDPDKRIRQIFFRPSRRLKINIKDGQKEE